MSSRNGIKSEAVRRSASATTAILHSLPSHVCGARSGISRRALERYTATMKLSVLDQSPITAGSTPAQALHTTIDLAKFTEALRYERYWIAEHHATASLDSPAPEIMIERVA